MNSRLMAGLSTAVLIAATATACGSSDAPGTTKSSDQDLAEFTAIVAAAEKPVTEWSGPTSTPVPPKDQSIAIIVCASVVSGCVLQSDGVEQAAKSLGWKVNKFDGKGDPVEQNKVMTQALNSGVDAVFLAGADPIPLKASMELAAKKGVPVGSMGQGIEPGTGGVAFDIAADSAHTGTVVGSWMVADSQGTATVLSTVGAEFQSNVIHTDALIAQVEKCDECEVVGNEKFVVSEIGNGLGQRIASLLQQKPQVDYVNGSFNGAAADMVPAIQSAGLGDRVKMASVVGGPQNMKYVEDQNVQRIDVVEDATYFGYAAVDQMIRLLSNEPLWQTPGVTTERVADDQGAPIRMITRDNVKELKGGNWAAENDYVATYLELWGVK